MSVLSDYYICGCRGCLYCQVFFGFQLPDYHEIIENPMDFETVRKKLLGGIYSFLEQLEVSVFLPMVLNCKVLLGHRTSWILLIILTGNLCYS